MSWGNRSGLSTDFIKLEIGKRRWRRLMGSMHLLCILIKTAQMSVKRGVSYTNSYTCHNIIIMVTKVLIIQSLYKSECQFIVSGTTCVINIIVVIKTVSESCENKVNVKSVSFSLTMIESSPYLHHLSSYYRLQRTWTNSWHFGCQ